MEVGEFDALYDASHARLVHQIHAMTGDRDGAEESVQEAFARAWARRRTFAEVHNPEAWLRTVAYRLAVSRWRSLSRSRRTADRALEPEPFTPGPDENHVALMAALDRLPSDQRRALVLHHVCDLSVAQVADEVGAPVGTVKARLSRGRTTLQQLLTTNDLDEGASRA